MQLIQLIELAQELEDFVRFFGVDSRQREAHVHQDVVARNYVLHVLEANLARYTAEVHTAHQQAVFLVT